MVTSEDLASTPAGSPLPPTRARKPVATGQLDYSPRQRAVIATLSVLIFFGLWELSTRTFDIPTLFLPKLSEIFAALVQSYQMGDLLPHTFTSVNLFFWSMLLSLAIAIPLGIIVGAFAVLDRTFTTWLWAFYTAPNLIFIPLVLVWVGITTTAKVVIIVLAAVPPAMVVIIEGVRAVEGKLLRVAHSFGASRAQSLRKVVMPAALPYIGTGVRMGVSRGLIGLFGAELFTAHEGLGFLLLHASKRYNTPLVFGILGTYLFFTIVAISGSASLEKRLNRWKE